MVQIINNNQTGSKKIIISKAEIDKFNQIHSDSTFGSFRHYWFEFDRDQDCIDTDVPNEICGTSAYDNLKLDCHDYLFEDVEPAWLIEEAKENNDTLFDEKKHRDAGVAEIFNALKYANTVTETINWKYGDQLFDTKSDAYLEAIAKLYELNYKAEDAALIIYAKFTVF